MKTSIAGRIKLMQHEAVMLDAYKDSKGIWTIGVGHTAAAGKPYPKQGMKISLKDALNLLASDLVKYEREVIKALRGAAVEQHQFDALVSFHFNTGGIARAELTKHIRNGDFDRAGKAFMGWSKPSEIIPRRQAERRLFESGVYGSLATVPMYPITSRYTPAWSKRKNISTAELSAMPAGFLASGETGVQERNYNEPSFEPDDVQLRYGTRSSLVRDLQEILAEKNYHTGQIVGHFGTHTRAAVLRMKAENGWSTENEAISVNRARTASPAYIAEERANATVHDVLRESKTAQAANSAMGGTTGTAVIGATVAAGGLNLEQAQDAVDKLEQGQALAIRAQDVVYQFTGGMLDMKKLIIGAGCIIVGWALYSAWQARKALMARVNDYRTGANL